jgi:hypothetical protein
MWQLFPMAKFALVLWPGAQALDSSSSCGAYLVRHQGNYHTCLAISGHELDLICSRIMHQYDGTDIPLLQKLF